MVDYGSSDGESIRAWICRGMIDILSATMGLWAESPDDRSVL